MNELAARWTLKIGDVTAEVTAACSVGSTVLADEAAWLPVDSS